MSYLKLIANAVWAGIYGSTLIAFLIIFLNEDLAGSRGILSRFAVILISISILYIPITALLFPTLFIFVRFFAQRRLGVQWVSLKAVTWLGAATLATLCIVFYHNLRWAVSLQSPAARDGLRLSLVAMVTCWTLAVALAGMAQLKPGVMGRRWRIAAGAALLLPVLVMALLVTRLTGVAASDDQAAGDVGEVAQAVEAIGRAGDAPSLLLVGLVGASMDDVLPLLAARELPELELLLKEGAVARLDTITPCVSRAAWTSLATGMPPWATGVKDTRVYRLKPSLLDPPEIGVLPRWLGLVAMGRAGLVGSSPTQAVRSRRQAFWEILRAAGVEVEVIGWPGAHPPPDRGTVMDSDPRVSARLQKILGEPANDDATLETGPLIRVLRRAIAEDLTARDAALAVRRSNPARSPRVLAVLFPGLGAVGRHFLRYHRPTEFGDVTAEETAKLGKVLGRYYGFVDELVAEQAVTAGSGAFLMVMSAHGVAPISALERLTRKLLPSSEEDESAPSGSWRRGPDGLLMIRGEGVAPGAKIEEADILDVMPTMLYLLGLPIERDLRGILLRRLFTREFLESHPVRLVPGHAPGSPRL